MKAALLKYSMLENIIYQKTKSKITTSSSIEKTFVTKQLIQI